jgi:AcrR family transcriptional regulator
VNRGSKIERLFTFPECEPMAAASLLRGAAASPRVRRRDRQRDAILRAAARLFRERGFADTGMRDIAAAADLSAANLYHYFDGKNELLFYCQDRALDRMLDAVASARRASTSAADRLQHVFTIHVQTLLDDVEGSSAHLQIESLPPALRAAIVKKRDRYEHALRRLIGDGIRAGELVDMPPAIVARAMLGALNWTVTWFRPEGPDTAASIGDTISRFLVRGIASRTPAARRLFPVVRGARPKGALR